jgi:hypothetical protein
LELVAPTQTGTLKGGGTAFLGGFACVITIAAQAPKHPWATWWFVLFLAVSLVTMAIGLLTISHEWLGFPRRWIRPHSVREAERVARRQALQMARYAVRDLFDQLISALQEHQRDLAVEIGHNLRFGMFFKTGAWSQYGHVLSGEDTREARGLVRAAFDKLERLNTDKQTRFDAASHDDVNDPRWKELAPEERQQREETIQAVRLALEALEEAKPPQALEPEATSSLYGKASLSTRRRIVSLKRWGLLRLLKRNANSSR